MKKTIAKKIIDTLENFDISIISNERQGESMIADLEWYSDAGEDVIISIWHRGNMKSFVDAFNEYACCFDPDEHAEMWVDHRGEGGCSSSIRELIDDADGIKAHLEKVANSLLRLVYGGAA